MNAPVAMDHPTQETLAVFAEGRLDFEERNRVIAHVADCGDCRDIVSAVQEFAQLELAGQPEGGTVVTGRFRPAAILAALAAALVVVFLGVPELRERIFDRGPNMNALVQEVRGRSTRAAGGRLSLALPYQRYSTNRGVNAEDDSLQLAGVELLHRETAAAAGAHPTVEQRHVMGVALLYLERRKEARAQLEAAVRQDSGETDLHRAIARSTNADLLNDLAVVYQNLDAFGAKETLPLAQEAISRAWSLKKTPAIAFTRATIVESLDDPDRAIAAWEEVRALETDPTWSAEVSTKVEDWKAISDERKRGVR
ncbi:MAG TPA: zf-HC2 domain-containing protein [Thermoanaerobaculia bacterium]|nr:zf-HC2 domain-containing protein [Thermoanaerobaculia bacterium]